MDNRFSPYQGTKPFLFISYGRGDIEVVLRVTAELRTQNYRIWYDEGIPVGTDWPMYISRRVNASSAVLFFLSGKSMVSPNCYSEMVSASQSGKPIICVLLDSSAQLLHDALLRDGKLTEEEIKQIRKRYCSLCGQTEVQKQTAGMHRLAGTIKESIVHIRGTGHLCVSNSCLQCINIQLYWPIPGQNYPNHSLAAAADSSCRLPDPFGNHRRSAFPADAA